MVERYDVVGFGAFLIVYGLLLRGIELGKVYAFGDFAPYYGARALGKFTHTWHAEQLGYTYIYNTVPVYLGLLTELGGVLAQNLFLLSLLPLGFLTFSVFARRYIERPTVLYLASGVYALNPVTIDEFVNGGVAPLIGFVGFPLVVHYLYAIHERDEWSDALKTGMVFGASNVVVWLTFWMILPFALFFGFAHRADPRRLVKFAGAGALGVVLSLPNFHHVLQRAGRFDEGRGILVDTLIWSYAEADVLSVLRLAGNHGARAMNELGYNTEPLMGVGLVIPLLAVFSVHREELRLYHAMVVSITGFMVLTGMGLTYPLFDLVPPLWSLRNPVKLQYPLLLSMALLFGCGVQRVFRTGLVDSNVALTGVLVLSLVTYTLPAQGALGLEQVRGDDYYISDDERGVVDQLDGRVLWVPYGYTTQLHLRHTYPDHVGVKSGGTLHGIQNTAFVTRLFDDLATGEPVGGRLENLGVRYVVVSKEPPERYGDGPPRLVRKWGAPWLWGSPTAYQRLFNTSPSFDVAYENHEYVVFEFTRSSSQEMVEQYQGLHTLRYPTTPDVRRTGSNRLENPSFENGTEGWWLPPDTDGRSVDAERGQVTIETENGEDLLPVAQDVDLQQRHPYQITVDVKGQGTLLLFWYDGEKSKDTLVTKESLPLTDSPVSFTAKSDVLSIRVKPTERTLIVREVGLFQTTYPPVTGLTENAQSIPGVAVNEEIQQGTTVASNLPSREASVHVTDAETVLGGDLVFDERYRQGVAVVPNEGTREEIPPDANVVTYQDGEVVDYWVTGEFDDTAVTIYRTSYDDRWSGPPGSTHFRAFGWANGFTNASPAAIEPPSNRLRAAVVDVWSLAWLLALAALAVLQLTRRRSERERHAGAKPWDEGEIL